MTFSFSPWVGPLGLPPLARLDRYSSLEKHVLALAVISDSFTAGARQSRRAMVNQERTIIFRPVSARPFSSSPQEVFFFGYPECSRAAVFSRFESSSLLIDGTLRRRTFTFIWSTSYADNPAFHFPFFGQSRELSVRAFLLLARKPHCVGSAV